MAATALLCFCKCMPTTSTQHKGCAKGAICWSVCVGFLRIGWFPDLLLHPTLVIFILLRRTNLNPDLKTKCFVSIRANLFIGVSHINALHNGRAGRLFDITFLWGWCHSVTALFWLQPAFLDIPKEAEHSQLCWRLERPQGLLPPAVRFCCSSPLFLFFFAGRAGLCIFSFSMLVSVAYFFPFCLQVTVVKTPQSISSQQTSYRFQQDWNLLTPQGNKDWMWTMGIQKIHRIQN